MSIKLPEMPLLSYPAAMRHKVRWIVGTFATILVFLAIVPLFSILVTSWYSRWEATRLLASARLLRPGATEAETRKALSQFDRYLSPGQEWTMAGHTSRRVTRDSYEISSYPRWTGWAASYLPFWINERIWFLPNTNFSVSPRFENGELVLLEFREWQDHRGDAHPYAAIVRVFSTNTEKGAPELPDDFTGFGVSPYEEAMFGANGKQIGSSWISRVYVTLDERASPAQFPESFNFHLDCFTSLRGCHDARKILEISELKSETRFRREQRVN
jgi:hypothetical protein